jgi:hypothetical protein
VDVTLAYLMMIMITVFTARSDARRFGVKPFRRLDSAQVLTQPEPSKER